MAGNYQVEASRVARGASVTVVGQIIRVMVQSINVVVLTRLLSPSDYGLLAIVLSVVMFGELIREFGLSAAAIQADSLNDSERDSLFWVNTLIGCLLAALAVLISPLVSNLYHDSRLTSILCALAPIFVFNGVAAQYRASLLRSQRFYPVAVSDIAGQVLGLILGVSLAVSGAGYWSLVGQQLAVFGVTTAVLIGAARWLPMFVLRLRGMGRFYRFGLEYTATQFIVYISQNIATLLIGWRYSISDAGLVNRAMQLTSMPLAQVSGPSTNVSLPVLSGLRKQPLLYSRYLVAGQNLIVGTLACMMFWAVPVMPILVSNVLGPQWAGATHLIQLLAVGVVFQSLGLPIFWTFVSYGFTRSNLLFSLVTRSLQVAAVVLAAIFGSPTTVVLVLLASYTISWPAGLLWLSVRHGILVKPLARSGVSVLTIFFLCALFAWLVARDISVGWIQVMVSSTVYAVTFVISLVFQPVRLLFYPFVRLASSVVGREEVAP